MPIPIPDDLPALLAAPNYLHLCAAASRRTAAQLVSMDA